MQRLDVPLNRVRADPQPQRDGFPAQRGKFFQWMVLNFLKRFRLIQEKHDFFGAKRFDAEHVAEAI